jgi:hypothetical protein
MLSSRSKSTVTKGKFRAGGMRAQVLLFKRPDRIPVEAEFPGNVLYGGLATVPPRVAGKASGTAVVVRHEAEPLAIHLAATSASGIPASNKSDDANHSIAKDSAHHGLRLRTLGPRLSPTVAAVSSQDWPYKERCRQIQSPCEAPEREYPCGFQSCFHP